jgi:hypothetical protein
MAALAFVGVGEAANSASATSIATTARAFTAGNHVFVYVAGNFIGSGTIAVTDTAGNTYTALAQQRPGGNAVSQWFYCLNATGHAANVVTATFSLSTTNRVIRALEFSGDAPAVARAGGLFDTNVTSLTLPDPGASVGPGSALLLGVAIASGTPASFTFSGVDNTTSVTWAEVGTHSTLGGVGYGLYPSGASNVAPRVTYPGNVTYSYIDALTLNLGTAPASDTKARVSQVAAEVLRTNLALKARTSQVAVEVLRINTGTKIRASQLAVEVLRPNADPAGASASRPVVFVAT